MTRKKPSLQKVKSFCAQHNIELTPLRQAILEILLDQNAPQSAYEILRQLRQTRDNAEPPTVYRVLEFFQQHGVVHRIQSSNSYIVCNDPHDHHQSQLLLCKSCGDATEIEEQSINSLVKKLTTSMGFQFENDLIEIHGICKKCQKN